MTYTYVGLVDTNIPATEEMEKQRLMSKFCPEIGQHYTVHFHMDSLDKHQYLLDTILDQLRREDGEYTYKGNLVDREKVTTILKQRYYALVLTCVTMESISASYKVLEFGKEDA